MELREFQVERTGRKKLPRQPLKIAPLGDIHYGDSALDKGKLREHLAELCHYDTYFLGMGDYLDIASPSNRRIINDTGLYDTVREFIEAQMRELLDEYVTIMKKSKGRWLGLVSGHHFFEFQDGTNTDQILCRELEAPYLGHCGMLRVSFMEPNRRVGARGSMVLWVHHGAGGGQTIAAPLNKLEKIAGRFDADVYLMGHQHKIGYAPIPYKRLSGLNVIDRTKHLVATGSFRKTYLAFSRDAVGKPHGEYVERKMYLPNAIGAPVINVWPKVEGRKSESFQPVVNIEGPKFEVFE